MTEPQTFQEPIEAVSTLPGFLAVLRMARERVSRNGKAPGEGLLLLLQAIRAERAVSAPPNHIDRPPVDPRGLAAFLETFSDARAQLGYDPRPLNIWKIAGLGRYEVRTASVLGWLLDGRQSHGLGPEILHEVLRIVTSRHPSVDLARLKGSTSHSVTLEHHVFADRDNRVDLVLENDTSVIFIEVKIDAPPGRDQLGRYTRLARQKAQAMHRETWILIYLSESKPPQMDGLVWLRWRDIASAVRTSVKEVGATGTSAAVLLQFADHVKSLH